MCVFIYCIYIYIYNMWAARDGVTRSSHHTLHGALATRGEGVDGLFNLLNRFYALIKYENVTREGCIRA